MRRFVIPAIALSVAAAGTAATAAPAGDTVTHANNRVCAAPAAGLAACFAVRHDTYVNGRRSPNAGTAISGYAPTDLLNAYNLTTAATGGSGRTVAIVDAYDLPTAEADVNTYRAQFGLTAFNSGGPAFTKVNQNGGSTAPAVDAGWGQEIALDIEMVSAICPNCNVLLVEANSASFADLATAVNTAAATAGVVAVSNSYGGSDSSAQSAYNHSNVAITASTGDNGYGVESPASYPTVTAVGGTSLTRSSTARGWSETAWSGAGSGCSRYNAKPAYQQGVNTQCSTRALADVSAVADPNTGVAVYDSTPYQGTSGWLKFGGTSVSSPIIASVYALAGTGFGPATPYAHTASLYDVTSGRNGRCNRTPVLCTAGAGWDGPTGLGTPNGTGAF